MQSLVTYRRCTKLKTERYVTHNERVDQELKFTTDETKQFLTYPNEKSVWLGSNDMVFPECRVITEAVFGSFSLGGRRCPRCDELNLYEGKLYIV
jgi:hypothetical protein